MRFLLAIICCIWHSYAVCTPGVLLKEREQYSLKSAITFHTLQGVSEIEGAWRESESWQPLPEDKVSLGFNRHGYLFHALLDNQVESKQWFLRITYPPIDNIDVYVCSERRITLIKNECYQYSTGDLLPFSQRGRNNPNFIIPLELNRGKNHLFIRMVTDGSYQIPASVMTAEKLADYLSKNDLLRGAYIGVLLVMFGYNFFIFLLLRSPTYFLYSATVISFLFFYLSYEGGGFQYLWPSNPDLNRIMMPISFSVNQFFTLLFVMNFFGFITKNKGGFFYYLSFLLIVSVLSFFLAFFVEYKYIIPFNSLMSLIVSGSAFLLGLYYWMKGENEARLFTVAWTLFLVGMIISNLRVFGVLPSNFFTLYGFQIGSFVEIVLLSLALGERIQNLQKQKIIANQESIEANKKVIKILRQYEDLYYRSSSALFQLDENMNFIKINPSFSNLVEYADVESIKRDDINFFSLLSKESQVKLKHDIKHRNKIEEFETVLKISSGKSLCILINMYQHHDEAGVKWEGTFTDLTDRKEKQKLIDKAHQEKMSSLQHLVVGVSHEMNTPVGNIKMSESIIDALQIELCAYLKGNRVSKVRLGNFIESQKEALEVIKGASDRLTHITDAVKHAYVDEQNYPLKVVELSTVVKNWVAHQVKSENIRLEIPEGLTFYCRLSVAGFNMVLSELWNNTIQHAHIGNSVDVEAKVQITECRHVINITYTDNGIEVNKDVAHNAFLPFYTGKREKKLGLGLYFAHNLISSVCCGTIEANIGTNRGLEFCIKLPKRQGGATI